MSDLVVITFKEEGSAAEALARIKSVEKGSGMSIRDFAVVEKGADGTLRHRGEADSTTKTGAIGGGFLGLLIGLVFFPVLGLAIGAMAGALIGKSLHHNVDPGLVRDVTADLTPGTSALFVLVDGHPSALVGAVSHLKGKVYQTNVDAELEGQLNDALSRG